MAILISGILVIASFLLASTLLFGTFLTTSVTQSQALKELAEVNKQQAGSRLKITSATVDSPAGTDVTLKIDTTGSQPVVRLARMDVIIEYTDPSDNRRQTYLQYNDAGAGNNQWAVPVDGIWPDAFNPGIWDPGETLTIELRVDPAIQEETSALIIVVTPWGIGDQISADN